MLGTPHAELKRDLSVMLMRQPGGWQLASPTKHTAGGPRSRWTLILLTGLLATCARGMSSSRIAELRSESVDMFYHGFDSYMTHAFPEDELRPVSCIPLTRDPSNPKHIEINDVLGNYSLTLIDSLSTLAILASAPPDDKGTGPKALRDFQHGITALVQQYGDGTDGPAGQGLRARGFDVDSKVQVFETVIRGVGGLLSAHLFAMGELPINNYEPYPKPDNQQMNRPEAGAAIPWPNGFQYDGQLLRLALDLGERLLPAFYSPTGMPYPRVNLRHGIPFYKNSPLHAQPCLDCTDEGPEEITETCSAGAGSLVLEFTVLSRLTGDPRFEELAKRAFWAVWVRRSSIGLIGAGIDAEAGHWVGSYAGIGAGADSFFEYALKTHILLSGHDLPNKTHATPKRSKSRTWIDPNTIFRPLTDEENASDSFLLAWQEAHASIKRHLYSGTHHPHYVNAHLGTGSPQAYWIDSLGAYYPGLLTLAGEVEEAVAANLLYAALWTRYSALPERWSVMNGHVEGGLAWWPGRPEFIESNYHLFRATKDPWYLHVAEMVIVDIQRRCWTACGWSGLQDVRSGEMSDRMESFFLGETAKYLYLLLDSGHPLNNLDAAYVFTTEGHPLILPREPSTFKKDRIRSGTTKQSSGVRNDLTCPVQPAMVPLTISATAARRDLFHAASLVGLRHVENVQSPLVYQDGELQPAENHTFYPWTLPLSLVPEDGFCAALPLRTTFSVEFPSNVPSPSISSGLNLMLGSHGITKTSDGFFIKSLQGIKVGMVLEEDTPIPSTQKGIPRSSWRIWTIGNMPLGRDEKVYVRRDVMGEMSDPSFTRVRDAVMADLILQMTTPIDTNQSSTLRTEASVTEDAVLLEPSVPDVFFELADPSAGAENPSSDKYKTLISSLLQQVTSVLRDPVETLLPALDTPLQTHHLRTFPAVSASGIGAVPLPDVDEAPDPTSASGEEALLWRSAFFAGQGCHGRLPDEAVRSHSLIVMRRGGCTFSQKLSTIPAFTPSTRGFQLLVIVSDDHEDEEKDEAAHAASETSTDPTHLVRPLLDELQRTPAGLLRHHQIPTVLVGGGHETYEMLRQAESFGLRRRYHVESQGIAIHNLYVV